MTFLRRLRAFTLIELLVALVILGILATIGFARFSSLRTESAKRVAQNSMDELVNAAKLHAVNAGADQSQWPTYLSAAAAGESKYTAVSPTLVQLAGADGCYQITPPSTTVSACPPPPAYLAAFTGGAALGSFATAPAPPSFTQMAVLNGYVYAVGNKNIVSKSTTTGAAGPTAGSSGTAGHVNAAGALARLGNPNSLVAYNGAIYFLDDESPATTNTWLRKFDPATLQVTDLMTFPYQHYRGLSVDGSGNFVTAHVNTTVGKIAVIDTTTWTAADTAGTMTNAYAGNLTGLVYANGDVYTSELNKVYKYSGGTRTEVTPGVAWVRPPGYTAQYPALAGFDSKYIYAVDFGSCVVIAWDPATNAYGNKIGTPGTCSTNLSTDPATATFNNPRGVAVGTDGVYVLPATNYLMKYS